MRRCALFAFRIVVTFAAISTSAFAIDGVFELESLPPGTNVTLPRPALTLAPMRGHVRITSTDMPQTVSIAPVFDGVAVVGQEFKVAIFDSNSDRVQYINLKSGTPFLYSFKTLSSVTIVPQALPPSVSVEKVKLKIESDKPLGLSR